MISKTLPAYDALTHEQALIPALKSVTWKQVDAAADIARASGQEWNFQTADDYDGYRFILIETAGHGDEQKSFFIAGIVQCLELFQGKDENLMLKGTFSDMGALRTRLTGVLGQQ